MRFPPPCSPGRQGLGTCALLQGHGLPPTTWTPCLEWVGDTGAAWCVFWRDKLGNGAFFPHSLCFPGCPYTRSWYGHLAAAHGALAASSRAEVPKHLSVKNKRRADM